jgi:signal recognition particle GTPase
VSETIWGTDEGGVFSAAVLAHQIEDVGNDAADKEAAAALLVKSLPHILSAMTNDERKRDTDLSRKEAEDLAKGSYAYQQAIREAVEAEREAARAKASYEAVKAYARLIQTEQANRRALANMR